jgi:hypothetical protein
MDAAPRGNEIAPGLWGLDRRGAKTTFLSGPRPTVSVIGRFERRIGYGDALSCTNGNFTFKTNSAAATLAGPSRGGPPLCPRTASGFFGRRFCRIYPDGNKWVLEAIGGGWTASRDDDNRKTFLTLTAAIVYAVANGFSYRVAHSPPDAGCRSALGAFPLPFAKKFSGGVDRRISAPNS